MTACNNDSELSLTELKQRISYNADTGWFTRKTVSKSRRLGVRAGAVADAEGYRKIAVAGRNYREHRLAWFYCYGKWPTDQLDHINGIRDDNRIQNLREANNSQNGQNLWKAQKNNRSSGLLGAYRHSNGVQWVASIYVNGKSTYLGLFANAETAHQAYLNAKRDLHAFGELARKTEKVKVARSVRNTATRKNRLRGAYPYGSRWTSRIMRDGIVKSLGYFDTESEAHEAYNKEKAPRF